MDGKFRVNEIANILGVSQTTVYKHFAKMKEALKPHHHKEKGILLFDEQALEIFRGLISTADKEIVPATPQPENGQGIRLEGIERSLMALVEAHRQESAAIRTEIAALRQENQTLRLALLPPPKPTREVIPWKPEDRLDPTEGMPWWKVAWLSLVSPEQLRRWES